MKIWRNLALFLFLLFLIEQNIVITSISNSPIDGKGDRYSSPAGGNTFYVKGTGFDLIPSNNVVFIGPYQATVTGVNDVFLIFDSVAVDGEGDYTISVVVTNTQTQQAKVSTCIASDCKIHYRWSVTTELYQIKPQSAAATEYVYFYGIDRFSSTSDIDNIKMGPFICDRVGLDDDDISFGSSNFIKCRVAIELISGEYTSSLLVKNRGYATKYPNFQGIDQSDGHLFDFRCIPMITEVSNNIGSPEGQILTIKGLGFTSNVSSLVVTAGDFPCTVLSTNTYTITCKVETTALNQTVFVKGAGIEKWLYSGSGSNAFSISNQQFANMFWNNNVTLPLISSSIENSFERIPTDDSVELTIVEAWKGLFKAPSSGSYRFYLAADDNSELWLSTVPNSIDPSNLNKIAYFYSYTAYSRFDTNDSLTSEPITLQKDQYYLINAFRNQGSGASHMWVGAQVPYDQWSPLKMDSTQMINITYNPIKEMQRLKINNYKVMNKFRIVVQWKNPATGKLDVDIQTSEMDYNVSDTELRTRLSSDLGWGTCTIVRSPLDTAGNIITDSTKLNQTTGYQYDITLPSYRNQIGGDNVQIQPAIKKSNTNDFYVSMTLERTQAPSAPISGNITVSFNGTDYEIPGNSSSVSNYFKSIPGLNKNYYSERKGSYLENHYYTIRFSGLVDVPVMTLKQNNLVGGQDKPLVEVTEIIPDSNNIFYSPIPNQLLFTFSDMPQILVKSENILGKCVAANCSYVIDNTITPQLESFTMNSEGLELTLSQYENVSITNVTTKISFAGSNCQISTIALPQISCLIQKNSDNSLQTEAGSHRPIIHISDIGYVKYNSTLANETINLQFTSLNNTNGGSSFGGQVIKITGHGFPLTDKSLVVVKIGESLCEILETSNSDLVIRVPKQDTCVSPCQLIIEMSGQSINATTYTYSDSATPSIATLTPSSSSPSQKELIKIEGAAFGTDATKLKVWLMNTTNSSIFYQLSIINVTDTQIFAVLGGGKIGNYYLNLELEGVGYSKTSTTDSNLFKYELTITNVSPTSGSVYGGTKLTFTGKNFSPINNQNQVFISDVINNMCDIISSSSTQLVCKTRVAPNSIIGSTQPIYVTQRVQDEAVCSVSGGCYFTFDQAKSPQITTSSVTARSGETVTLAGTKLAPESGGSTWITFYNGSSRGVTLDVNVTVEAATAIDTEITFTMPALREGTYQIQVLVDNKGWALLPDGFLVTNPLEVYGIKLNDSNLNSTRTGSKGGLMIEIVGNGFYNENIYIDTMKTYGTIYSRSETSIVFTTGLVTSYRAYALYVYRDSSNKITCTNCSFTSDASLTSTLTSHNANTNMSSSFELTAVGTFLSAGGACIVTLDLADYSTKKIINSFAATVTTFNSTNIIASFANIPMGVYKLNILIPESGYVFFSNVIYQNVTVVASNLVAASVISSFMGGNTLTITGSGLPIDWTNNMIYNITTCGSLCEITSAAVSSVSCKTPGLITQNIADNYNLEKHLIAEQTNYVIYSDVSAQQKQINDGKVNTYYDSASTSCYLMFDFGQNFAINLTSIKYYPLLTKSLSYFYGLTFQGSNNNVDFVDLFTLNETLKTGWNTWQAPESTINYRYIRLTPNATHNTSRCNIAEVKFNGFLTYTGTSTLASTSCDGIVNLNGNQVVLTSAVEYRQDSTPVVQSLSPILGPTTGGTEVTITGTGFGTDNSKVSILMDNVECIVSSTTATSIVCTTGMRTEFVQSSLVVKIDGRTALLSTDPFLYIDRWSDATTWGGESPPREGDSVYIPSGQNVLLDVSTPILNSVIIEGTLIFEDKDMTFDAYYLICMQGKVQIGTFDSPFQSKLTITMHGRKWYPKQLPEFGNKVWAFHQATLEMHGKPKQYTWTLLSQTSEAGSSTITVADAVDWSVGDRIAIASTDFEHYHSEDRYITSISTDKKTLTLDSPLVYRHYGVIETYGTSKFPMQAEVGLLTRNVVFRGSTDEVVPDDKYGAHLMLHLPGAIGRISYTEFTDVGQGFIIGRYPMHFHRIDDASDSYCIGNAVHHSWARVVAIHDTHFLTVQKNVGYFIYGHSYFIEDGIETNNLLEDNLGISTIQIWTLINTDTTSATFWITNPNNIIRRNRAAGGDWFGFWYKLENRVTGPSSNPNICPDGEKMGIFENNYAHSYNQSLRMTFYMPRTYPCVAEDDPMYYETNNWFDENPPIHATFSDFTSFKNKEHGLLIEMIGAIEFTNLLIADSLVSAIEISQTNFTRESDEAQVNNALIVGISQGNTESDITYNNSIGIITPRTDFLLINNVTFYNFPFEQNMTAFKSCSKCWHVKLKITGGKTTKFSNLKFVDVGRKILWEVPMKEIFVDLDGTFTETGKKGMITKYYPHLDNISECELMNSTIYDDSVWCNETVQIRSVMFRNAIPSEMYRGLDIRILRIPSIDYNMSETNATNFTSVAMIKNKVDTLYAWDFPFVTGYIYNVHWQNGNLDWTHMNFYPTPVWKPEDKGIVFRFNYTDIREDYDIHIIKWNGTTINGTRFNETNTTLNPVTDNYTSGDYILANVSKLLTLGINGKENGTIDADAVRCRLYCPTINDTNATVEDFIRNWSNASMWPNGQLPQENEVAVVVQGWRVRLDIDPPNLKSLIVDGELIFDTSRAVSQLNSSLIWVRLGSITAGSTASPFPGKITINMSGNRNSEQLLIDSIIDTSSNTIAVTGSMKLYGQTRKSWSKLAAVANPGDSQITLVDSVDWKIGDVIVIAPTESNPLAYERKTITNVNGNILTLDSSIVYSHYGDTTTTYTSDFGGVLDMRAGVGLLSRNIKITTDPANNWGVNLLVYEFTDNNDIVRRGNAEFQGVEISYGGHPDTERSSLDIKYVQSEGPRTIIANSSIHDGIGWCVHSYSSNNISIENNVFFNCEKHLTRASYTNEFRFVSNLLIAPRKRNLTADTGFYDMVAGLDMYLGGKRKNQGSKIYITNNWVQGGGGNGFVMPGMVCGETNIGFFNNHAQSVTYAGLIIYKNGSDCAEISDMSISRCHSGVLTNFNMEGVRISRMILAENDVASNIWMGREADDIVLRFTDILFLALARANCLYCYTSASLCSDKKAIYLPIVQIAGKDIPIDKNYPEGILSQCTDSAMDSKLILTNVQFTNYKLDYQSDANENFRLCKNNIVFQQPSIPDQASRVFLHNTKAKNSASVAYFGFEEPPQNFLGWRGGCGDFNCSGNKNWLLTDTDGSLFGKISQAIPQNLGITNPACTDNQQWNGRLCTGLNFGMIEFQNDGPDQRLRIIAPVNITSELMKNTLNQWREWLWLGPDPKDQRLSRFNGIVERNKSMEMEFEVVVPEELKLKLENYGEFWWTVVTIRYERPNVIEVWNLKNKTLIKAHRKDQNINLTDYVTKAEACGMNIYDPDNSTIKFILNNDVSCVLKVRTINAIRITMHLETTVEDFYKNNGDATFIDKISTFLGLDLSRVRIAKIRTGSVYVDFDIVENKDLTNSTSALDSNNSNYTNVSNASQIAEFNEMIAGLKALGDNLKNAVANGSFTYENFTVLGIETKLIYTNISIETNTSNNSNNDSNNNWNNNDNNNTNKNNTQPSVTVQEEDSTTMIILLATLIPGFTLLFLLLCCCIKNKEGVSLIKMAFEYSFAKKEVEVTFNQELINQSKHESDKWKDPEAPFDDKSVRHDIEEERKDLSYTEKYLQQKN